MIKKNKLNIRILLLAILFHILVVGCARQPHTDVLGSTDMPFSKLYPEDIAKQCTLKGGRIKTELPLIIAYLRKMSDYRGNIISVEILGPFATPLFAKVKTGDQIYFLTKYNFARLWTIIPPEDFIVFKTDYEL